MPVSVFDTGRESKNELISMVEGINDPYFGVAYSIDQVASINNCNEEIDHSIEARRHSAHIANFLVDEAKRNKNRFGSHEEEMNSMIDNYDVAAVELKHEGVYNVRDVYIL